VRKLALFAALLVVALVAGACELPPSDYAAQVGGTTITPAQVSSAIAGVSTDSAFTCVLSATGSGLTVAGKGSGSYSTSFAASVLTGWIHLNALQAELARDHLSDTSFAQQVAIAQLESQLTSPDSDSTGEEEPECPGSGAEALEGLPTAYRNLLVGLQTDVDILYAKQHGYVLTTAGFTKYAGAHGDLLKQRCLSLIEVKSLGSAKSVEAAIAGGASFATQAQKHSLDTQTADQGGAIGCIPNNEDASLAAPLNTVIPNLKLGVVSAPISFEGAYLLLLLTSIEAVPLVEDATFLLPPAALFALGSSGTYETAELSAVETALAAPVLDHEQVAVAPAYGTWQKVDGAWKVVPPSGPSSALMSNPTAVGDTGVTGAAAGTTGG
jgi:hypothetical protein